MENDPLIGRELGVYLIQARLGEGGMARVYKAYHARLRRDVAIKVILPQVASEEGFKERFEREAQVIASLEHPNIVAVYDFGDIEHLTCLVMQYVGGGTLRDRLRGEQPLDPRQAASYAQQMARALHHAHLRGIVHRDVKPQNMLISASDPNQLLLSDFGIAKLFDSRQEATLSTLISGSQGSGNDASLTNVGQIVGTAEYMAPEQINMQHVDARTDVYALGVVLYQMLTGQVPFHSTTVHGLLFQHVYTPPRPLQEVNPSVPDILAQITMRAMEKSPQQRFQSAEMMAQAVEIALTHATHPLSSSLPGNFATYNTAQGNAITYLSQQPYPGGPHSYHNYGSQPPVSAVSAGQTAFPPMRTNGQDVAAPAPVRPVRRGGVMTIAFSVILALGVLLAVLWPHLPFSTSTSTGGTAKQATPFVENFQSDDQGWPQGQWGHLVAGFQNGYTLNVDGNVNNLDYLFPHPDQSSVGTLPDNFTLKGQFQQTQGNTAVLYGITFNLTLNADGTKVYCYAFVINSQGDFQVWRFDSDATKRPQILWQGQQSPLVHSGLNKSNSLQVTVTGNGASFKINDQVVQVTAGGGTTLTDTDGTPYKGGIMGLMVTGPNASFVVQSLQLSIP